MNNNKLLACFSFVALLLLTLFFYKERMFYLDTSYQFFTLVNNNSLVFEASRYGTFFTKIIPYLLVQLNAPLSIVAPVFSVGFVGVYAIVFVIATKVFKSIEGGLIIILSCFVGYADNFFDPVTEIQQAMIYSSLFYSFIFSPIAYTKSKQLLIGTILILLSFYTHPAAIFVVLFILGLKYVVKKKENYAYWLFIPILILIVSLKLFFTSKTSYEGNFIHNIWSIDTFDSNKNLIIQFLIAPKRIIFYALPFLMFLGVLLKIYQNKKVFFYSLFSVIGCFIISIIIYQNDDSAAPLLERSMIPVIVLITILFIRAVTPQPLNRKNGILLLGIVVCSIASILVVSRKYSYRINYFETILVEKNVSKKQIIPEEKLPINLEITWSIPYETALISALKGKEKAKTIFVSRPINQSIINKADLKNTGLFLGCGFQPTLNTTKFNSNYFILNTEKYIKQVN